MKKVLIGLSGGVDSSVAAYLLKKNGYDVTGCTLLLFGKGTDDYMKNATDAKKVCEHLDIPHITLDLCDAFKEKVIDNFVDEYAKGRTPNPCIQCNINIKFGAMLKFALENGFDYIATGHYAKIVEKNNRFYLHRADDEKKDQSYFLYHLTDKELSHIIFPLSSLSKSEIREIAHKNGLPVAEKKDSMEICFVPNDDYISFLKKSGKSFLPEGNFIDKDNNIIGRHKGIHYYTIGQRKGLGVTFGKPMFVTAINAKENTVTLGEKGDEFGTSLILEDVITAFDVEKSNSVKGNIKLRYAAKPESATAIFKDDKTVEIVLENPARAITPGQIAVLYDGDKVILGGIIK